MNNKPEIGTIVTFNSSFGSTTGKVVGYATLDPDTLQIESNGDIFAKHYGDVTAVVETPAAPDSELSPKAQRVLTHWQAQYSETSRGLKTWRLANGEWINESDIDELVAAGLVNRINRHSLIGPLEALNAKGLAYVVTPTIATVAITDDSAVDNTPSEPKSNDGQPSAGFIQAGDTVKFFNDNNEVVSGEVEGFTSTGQLIIRYNGGQVRRHRMGVNKVNPQPSASKTCSKCNAPMIEIEPVDEGDDAALKMWQCTKCTKIEMNYAEYFFGEPMQPVSGWVADALATVNVTSEAAVNDEYLPPTGDDNDDLPFSDLGEDHIVYPNWDSIDGDIMDSQRERIYELEAQNWQRNETIASLEARVKVLEATIQFSLEFLSYGKHVELDETIVDEIKTRLNEAVQ